MSPLKSWLIARLREPSTYAGLSAIIGAAGITVAPHVWEAVVGVVVAVAGLAAVLLPERKADDAKTR